MKIRNNIAVCTALVAALTFSGAAHALIIDDFNTDAFVQITAAALSSGSIATVDSGAGMIGNRNIVVNKTVGPIGNANAAIAEVLGGVLNLSNGPQANSVINVSWLFGATDLTEGGTATGLFLSLPTPIDNDLNVAFSLNGGTILNRLFLNGATGNDFFISFADFANAGDATAATSLSLSFSDGIAWDAAIDFVETRPRTVTVPEPGILALFGIAALGLAGMRRRKH